MIIYNYFEMKNNNKKSKEQFGKKEQFVILFENLSKQFDVLGEGLNSKIDGLETRLTNKIDIVDKKVEDVKYALRVVREDLSKKIDETNQKLDETKQELGDKIDKINIRFEYHEERFVKLEKIIPPLTTTP